MNRTAVERVRDNAKFWADIYKTQMGLDDGELPRTPGEAYARASWHAEMQMTDLCDALLAEEPKPEPTVQEYPCQFCGHVPGPGELANYGARYRPGIGTSRIGPMCWDTVACHRREALANWSA